MGAAAMTPLTDAEIARRMPVWVAMSDLFLDTYPFDWTIRHITRVIDEAGFTAAEARAIFREEVGPAFAGNLLSVAGEWAMFGEELVRDEVLKHIARGRPAGFPVRGMIDDITGRDWRVVESQLLALRTPGLRTATSADSAAIRTLIVAAFGRVDEADLTARLRSAGDAVVEVVCERDGAIVAHALFSRLAYTVADSPVPALALAPVSAAPDAQRTGLGAAVVGHGLDICRAGETAAVFVLGDPRYYTRFGFSAEEARNVASPYAGKHFMGLALKPLALSASGVVRYPAAFGET